MAEKKDTETASSRPKETKDDAEEEATVQAGASAPVPAAPPAEPEESPAEAVEAAEEVATHLTDLSHSELTRLQGAVTSALQTKGSEPAPPRGPSLEEVSGAMPLNEDATAEYDIKSAAKAFDDVDPEDVLGYGVRQELDPSGEPTGDQYLRVVTTSGKKYTAKV